MSADRDPADDLLIQPTLSGPLFSRLRMRHLAALERLAERGNIRQASLDLFVSQPAASKLLREIEAIFNARLFDRTAHGIEITAQGRTLLHWARKATADMEAARAEIAAMQQGWEGRVRVGVFPVAAPVLVPRAVVRMRTLRPNIQVQLHEGLETTLLPLLEQGRLDCVIGRATTVPGSHGFAHEVLFEEPTVIVCAPDHPLLGKTDWVAADIDTYHWALPAPSGQLYALVAGGLATRHAARPRVAVETSSTLTLIEILNQSRLLSAIASGVAERYVAMGLLSLLDLPLPATLHPVSIITDPTAVIHPALAAFLDAIRATARTRPRTGRESA